MRGLTTSRSVGGHVTVWVWGGNPRRQNCDGSRAHNADRLLIRPASGRQADTGLSARTHHWKDIRERSHSQIESQTKSTDANLTNAPDGTAQFGGQLDAGVEILNLDLDDLDEYGFQVLRTRLSKRHRRLQAIAGHLTRLVESLRV